MCDLRAGTLVGQAGTRVPFSDSSLSLTFPIEQFWGRAARASWVRKNPDARLIRRVCGADTPFDFAQGGFCPRKDQGQNQRKNKRQNQGQRARAPAPHGRPQFVEMVKFTVMLACVSTGCPFCK